MHGAISAIITIFSFPSKKYFSTYPSTDTTKTRTNYQFIFKNFFAPWVRGKPAVYTPDFVKLNYKNEI